MKNFISMGVALIFIGVNTATAQQQGPESSQPDSVKAEEILQKAIAAAGGKKAFENIDNFTIKTENVIFGADQNIDLTVTETVQLPDKTKQIMELTAGTRIQVLNGANSWKQVGKDVSPLSNLEKKEMQRALFRDLINLYKSYSLRAFQVQYLGKETLGGKTSHVLHIKNPFGDFFNIYVDAETFLVRKKTYHGASEVGLATLEENYSDYRTIDGIKIPFLTTVRAKGQKFIEAKVVDVQINSELGENFFEKK